MQLYLQQCKTCNSEGKAMNNDVKILSSVNLIVVIVVYEINLYKV